LVISFNYNNNKAIWLTMKNTDLDIDKLLAKLDGLQALVIDNSVGNIKITRFPQTLTKLINYSPNLKISNLPETLEYYKCNWVSKPIVIPELPTKNIMLHLEGKCITNSFYSLSSLITDITINVLYLDLDIDMWPMNLIRILLHLVFYLMG